MSREARKQAEKALTGGRFAGNRPATSLAVATAGARIGWALLDVADAIREHAEATRPRRTGPPYVNRGER